ncbi:MAG: GTP pyrophosphokinase family protein [Clostridiales bacterium]|nr:GTP pyrophosphokinase family protein [Clostridiales bacterium]
MSEVFSEEMLLNKMDDNDIEAVEEKFAELQEMMMIYRSAIREVSTKFEVLNDEFQSKWKRNPIEYMKSRVKTPKSIFKKLEKRGLEISISSARENLHDIAGIRVICSFVDDIYAIANMVKQQQDIKLIEEKDYIKNPKPNGYRSLHLVLEIPVFFSDHVENVNVEVQIRTIAMDFWASLEHKLYYKKVVDDSCHVSAELKKCADIIASTDMKMQEIHDMVEKLEC